MLAGQKHAGGGGLIVFTLTRLEQYYEACPDSSKTHCISNQDFNKINSSFLEPQSKFMDQNHDTDTKYFKLDEEYKYNKQTIKKGCPFCQINFRFSRLVESRKTTRF